jgi:hypothetical protein
VITGRIGQGRFVEMATIEDAAKLALALPDVIEDDATEIGRGRSPASSPGNGRTPRPTSSGSVMRRRRASRSSPFASTT